MTIPVVNSLNALRCQQDGEGPRSGWRLRITRAAVDREQLGPESRSTRRATPSRRPDLHALGRPTPSRVLPFPRLDRAIARRSTSRAPAEEGKYIWISFLAGGRRATVNGQDQPITCLVRSGRGKIAYFSNAKGNYVVGLDGKRLYAEKNELLQTLNQEGLNWYLALDAKAYPPELRKKMD